jgi:hypothetical protein
MHLRQPLKPIRFCHSTGKHCPDRAIHISDRQIERNFLSLLQRRFAQLDQLVIEHTCETMVLLLHTEAGYLRPNIRHLQEWGQIQPPALPVIDGLLCFQFIHPSNHLIDSPEAQFGHNLAQFFRDKEKEIHDMFRLPGKFLPQGRVLRRDADGAGIEMAFPHHDAAFDDQRRGCKPEFLGAQQSSDRHIPSGFHLPVGLHPDTPSQIVEYEGLVRFG